MMMRMSREGKWLMDTRRATGIDEAMGDGGIKDDAKDDKDMAAKLAKDGAKCMYLGNQFNLLYASLVRTLQHA